MTVDIEKAFDSINHSFLMCVLKKIGFGNGFRKWIHILMKNPESCVTNDGKTTPYCKLESWTRQGDPISAYLTSSRRLEDIFWWRLTKANICLDHQGVFKMSSEDGGERRLQDVFTKTNTFWVIISCQWVLLVWQVDY